MTCEVYSSVHIHNHPYTSRVHTPHTHVQFDHKKQRKEDDEKLQRAVKLFNEKKAAKKLKEMKTESEMRQLEYKGMLVRSKLVVHVHVCGNLITNLHPVRSP